MSAESGETRDHTLVSDSTTQTDSRIEKYFSLEIKRKSEKIEKKTVKMSWTGQNIMQADSATVKICGHSFDPCYLVSAIEEQAIFPRLRSEYDDGGLRSACPQCNQPFNPFEDIILIQNTKL